MSIPKTCSLGWSGARLSVGLSQDLPHTPPLCIPALKLSMSQSSGLGNSLILCSFVPSSWCCSSAGGFGECHGGLRERMRPSQPRVRDSQSTLLLWRGCRQTDRQTGLAHLTSLPCSRLGLGREARSFKEMQEMFLCFLCTAALLSSSLIVTVKCEKNGMVFPSLQTHERG